MFLIQLGFLRHIVLGLVRFFMIMWENDWHRETDFPCYTFDPSDISLVFICVKWKTCPHWPQCVRIKIVSTICSCLANHKTAFSQYLAINDVLNTWATPLKLLKKAKTLTHCFALEILSCITQLTFYSWKLKEVHMRTEDKSIGYHDEWQSL